MSVGPRREGSTEATEISARPPEIWVNAVLAGRDSDGEGESVPYRGQRSRRTRPL